MPRYLTMFQSDNPGDYDAAGCIRWLNDFAEEHNRALRRMLGQLRPRDDHPGVAVVYADYYGAILEITRNPLKHGTCHNLNQTCFTDSRNCRSNMLLQKSKTGNSTEIKVIKFNMQGSGRMSR